MNQRSPLEVIFFAALEKGSPGERAAYLDEACAGDPDLRRRVEKMLAAQARAGDFLEQPAPLPGATIDEPLVEALGTRIGPYKLLQQIGEGGMGIVFMAEQLEPVQRKVALKVIKTGMDSREVIARFEAERQALAMMDHVNIARVFDGGATENGRPYFVMELIHGVPITRYCDDHHLTPRQRLELFVPVCQAVQHAHQKGIIHRDLKPSNVLVAPFDGRPVVKVIDFGVAKAAGPRLTDRTLFTEFGAVVGTLEYMSPEQAELNNADIDTRSDVYSLGVLLYELLTGTTPLERGRLRQAGFAEVLRLIREEEPPKPSTRLSDSRDALPSISVQRQTDPAKLARLVRGELDWIVMKALEKDRGRRYETANGFAADVLRYLADEPVLACPPSAAYRLRKLVRRNRGAVLAGALVFAALLAGVAGTAAALVESRRQERAAKAARQKEAERADAEARQRRAARKAVDDMYVQVALRWMADQPRMQNVQREFLEKARDYYAEFALAESDDPRERFEAGYAAFRVADIEHKLGRLPEAETAYRQAIAVFEPLTADGTSDGRFALARGHNRLAGILIQRSQHQAALDAYGRAEVAGRAAVAEYPDMPRHWLELAGAIHGRGYVLSKLGRLPEAERAYREALEIRLTRLKSSADQPDQLLDLAGNERDLGNLLVNTRRPAEAAPVFAAAVGHLEQLVHKHPRSAQCREHLTMARNGLAMALRESDQLPAAVRVQGQAVELQTALAKDFPDVPQFQRTLAASLTNLGVMAKAAGQCDRAEQAYVQAVAAADALAARFPAVAEYRDLQATCYLNLSNLRREAERWPEAEAGYGRARELAAGLVEKYPNVPHYRDRLGTIWSALSVVLFRTDRFAEAQRACRAALQYTPDDQSPKQALAWSLATCRDPALRNPAEAVALAKQLVEQAGNEFDFWVTLGVAQFRAGDAAATVAALTRADALRTEPDPVLGFALAMAHAKLGHATDAREWYDRAAGWAAQGKPTDARRRFHAEAAAVLGLPPPAGKK